jgi:S-adenosylmethionine synthetase
MKTAECVTPSHPDKMCDQISDAILDACLEQDPNSRVAIETMGGHGIITITGELTTNAYVDIREIAQEVYKSCGYKNLIGVQVNVVAQSNEIANGVDTGGAGDQGIMVGYACNDNEELIPQELYLARSLAKFIYKKYKEDGKTQITLKDGYIETVVVSFANVTGDELKELVTDWYAEELPGVVKPFIIHANPAGDWNISGFDADTGLTGRKLVVDNYGPQISLGGGCFSGKDATKVDRSGAYMARYIATDLLKKHNAKIVKTKLAYAIGVAQPVMITATVVNEENDVDEVDITKDYDCTPNGIIKLLKLTEPQYRETSKWGHFGNGFKWDL